MNNEEKEIMHHNMMVYFYTGLFVGSFITALLIVTFTA
jgi:hypothetical protein